jgi:hypothetical protein
MMSPSLLCEAIVKVLIKVYPVRFPGFRVIVKVIPINFRDLKSLTAELSFSDLQLFVSFASRWSGFCSLLFRHRSSLLGLVRCLHLVLYFRCFFSWCLRFNLVLCLVLGFLLDKDGLLWDIFLVVEETTKLDFIFANLVRRRDTYHDDMIKTYKA